MPDADLIIPSHLLPGDGRFGSGPTKVRREALRRLTELGVTVMGTSHRKGPVRDEVGRLQEGLAQLLGLPDGHEVVLGVGGATAFWEVAAFCLVEQRSLHYVFGEFSSKFAAATDAAPWLDGPRLVEADPGGRPDLTSDDRVDAQALTQNETSTGVAMEVTRPGGDALVLVDATSGAGGLPVDLEQVDAYYFSLQKGFGSDGGLWVAVLSPEAIDRARQLSAERYVPAFLDLGLAVDNSRKRQTYNTPALATVILAADQVDWMLQLGGLDAVVGDCAAKAEHVYGWAERRPWATPFVADPDARSNIVATIDLDGVSADDVNEVLRRNGVVDTDGYRKLGRNQLRVGMFPAIGRDDVVAYTACVDWIVEQLTA